MEKIQEITECCICTNIFTEPRILPCIHTFCLKCLDETALKRMLKPGDSVPCPLCRKHFVIPKEGMVGLQKNVFVERMVEILEASAQSGNTPCEICKSEDEEGAKDIPLAVQYCVQCRQNICDLCCRDHKRFKDLQNHQLVQVGSTLKDELIRKASLQYCTLHGKEEVKLFCVECNEVICLMCFAQKHKSHNCSDIEEVAERFCQQIKCDVQEMRGFLDVNSRKIQLIDNLQMNFQKKVEDVEKEIIQRGKELKELVRKCTRSLLDELSLIRRRVSKENKSAREERETHGISIQSFETYCMELSSKGSSTEVCRAANAMHLRAKELQAMQHKYFLQQFTSTEVELQTSDVEEFLKKGNIVGNIREFRQTDGKVKQIRNVKVQGKGTLNTSDMINGVTKLENKIYVLLVKCRKPNSIRVYDDQEPFSRQRDIYIKQTKNPVHLTGSDKSKSLYVADLASKCMWKMTVKNRGLTKWITGFDSGPFAMSVTEEDHLLVHIEGQSSTNIEIYGSDAKLIRRLTFRSDVLQPRCVIQNSNGEFIVSHQLNIISDTGPLVISRLTSDGQRLISRSNPSDKLEELKKPLGMTLDSDNNLLFVTDYERHQVNVFDSTSLKFIANLLSKEDGIYLPRDIWYDAEKKQLILAHLTGDVSVYFLRIT